MNDRFRFRVFYKPHNKIYNVICLNSDRQKEIIIEYKDSTALVEWENCDILQCTGLKDKNDRLIYEGDIVKDISLNMIFKVGYKKLAFYLENQEHIGYFHELANAYSSKRLEVIGNIYENKELLEEE